MTNFVNVKHQSWLKSYKFQELMALEGDIVSRDSISSVTKTTLGGHEVFVKKYFKPGKNLYRKLSQYTKFAISKGASEFRNLLYFANNGFRTPEIIFFDEQQGKACLITKGLVNSLDLCKFYTKNKPNRTSKHNNFGYLFTFTEIISKLHQLDFIHSDYKLRNVLLGEDDNLYLIDCPVGFRNILKLNNAKYKFRDLAILYKDLKKLLSRTQMLVLYKHYFGISQQPLDATHKSNIKYIMRYYSS